MLAGFVCGVSRDDEAPELNVEILDDAAIPDEAPPLEFTGNNDTERHASSVFTSVAAELVGDVLRCGRAWLLRDDGTTETVRGGMLQLYSNGLCFEPEVSGSRDDAPVVVLPPFCFARPVDRHSAVLQKAILPTCCAKIFSATFYLQGRTLFFAVSGESESEATKLCMQWVKDISCAIRWVTESLFVNGSCCQVAPALASFGGGPGGNRLLASYLLLGCESSEAVRVVFAELHAPSAGRAWILLHETSMPNSIPWQEVLIDSRTPCFEKVGHDCSIFCIAHLQLTARTIFERQLWLRAVENVKVKLQSKGPDPQLQDILAWRDAINEHIWKNVSKLRNRIAVFPQTVSGRATGAPKADIPVQRRGESGTSTAPVLKPRMQLAARVPQEFLSSFEEAALIMDDLRSTPLLRECEAGPF